MQLTRRHRAVTLSLAVLAAGVFLLFITRVFLLGLPKGEPRTCTASALFRDLSFTDLQRTYHWTMEQLLEERMRLYEGRALLACSEGTMEDVIPAGALAESISFELPAFPNPPQFRYSDFEFLITELWRTYDCHLHAAQENPALLEGLFPEEELNRYHLQVGVAYAREDVLEPERLRARATFDRLLFSLRASEQYLPLHASLRCLQRGGADVRNAFALLSDQAQCFPAKLSQPETSLLK